MGGAGEEVAVERLDVGEAGIALQGLAEVLFSRYVIAFEGTADLPIGEAAWDGFQATDSCKEFFLIKLDSAAPAPLDFTRGYQWVDVQRGQKRFRFINTHLEAFGDTKIREAQACCLRAPAGIAA